MDLSLTEKSWAPMMWRDFAIALSLSNLCFLGEWRWLLIPSHSFYYYHDKVPPPPPIYAGLAFNVLLLAAFFLIVARLVRRSGNETLKKCTRVVFVLTLCVPLYGLLSQVDNYSVRQLLLPLMHDEITVRRVLFTASVTGALFITLVALRKTRKAVKVATTVILILVPLVLITFSQAFFMAMKYGRLQPEALATPFTAEGTSKNTRVVWFVFDEMDFRAAFSERPSNVVLPELDRLTGESLFASNSFPPAQETLLSMPALTTGKLVSSVHRVSPAELMIEFGDGVEAVPWSKESNIFSRARELGFDTALIGWYHPYCRILGNSLTRCTWTGGLPPSKSEQKPNRALETDWSAAFNMRSFARRLVRSIPAAGFIFLERDIPSLEREIQVSKFNLTYRQAAEAATDPALGLVLVHWGIPHPPNIYDRSEKRISAVPGRSYFDNLALVDRTIGDIRRAMESKDNWKNTVVLITSDHWWRMTHWKEKGVLTEEDQAILKGETDRRVPFILKMTGDGSGLNYTEPFNTILTHDLLLAILRGEVVDTKGAAAWLDQHRTIGRSPYDERSSKDLF